MIAMELQSMHSRGSDVNIIQNSEFKIHAVESQSTHKKKSLYGRNRKNQ